MAMKQCHKCNHWYVETAGHLCEKDVTKLKKARGMQTPILLQVGVIRVRQYGHEPTEVVETQEES